jgi:hypothetical protein
VSRFSETVSDTEARGAFQKWKDQYVRSRGGNALNAGKAD